MARSTRAAAAADRKAAAESGKANPNQKLIDALKMERQGYVHRGLQDRVKQVDAQLKHYGATPPSGPSAAEKKAAADKAEAEKQATEGGIAGESADATGGSADDDK